MAQVKTPAQKLRLTQRDFIRFMSKVIISQEETPDGYTGCWLWGEMGLAALSDDGYGQGSIRSKRVQVHRAVFEFCMGIEIPEGMELDHLCKVRNCCNPNHLEVVTKAENLRRRGWNKMVKARVAKKARKASAA